MSFGCAHCDARWSGHRIEHCSACHQTFSGQEAGDKHRVGPMDDRRCLDTLEMLALTTKQGELWYADDINIYGVVVWRRNRPDTRWEPGERDTEAIEESEGSPHGGSD